MYEFIDKNGNISANSAKVIVIDKNGLVKEISTGGGGGSPTGPAGGDLSGTYPNPNVVWANGQPTYDLVYYPLTSNPAGYLTSSALTPYLTTAAAVLTYYPIPTGTTSQYIRGDGTFATFPTITTPTLQQVTDVGNTTTNEIIVGTNFTNGLTLNQQYANIGLQDSTYVYQSGIIYSNFYSNANEILTGKSYLASLEAVNGLLLNTFGDIGYVQLKSDLVTTAVRTIQFPDASGTIALTSDIPLPSERRNANNSSNNNINYNGYAVTGSAEASAVWTITRLTIAASGSITIATATNVAWTNRESATYI